MITFIDLFDNQMALRMKKYYYFLYLILLFYKDIIRIIQINFHFLSYQIGKVQTVIYFFYEFRFKH